MQSPNTSLEEAYRNGLRWSSIGALGTALLQLLQMVVFARLAGPAAAGDYALAAVFMGFLVPLAEAGLSQAVVQTRELRSEQLTTLLWVNLGIGVVVLMLVLLGGPVLAAWYDRPELAGLMTLMGGALLITPFGVVQGAWLLRTMRFDLVARIEIFSWLGSSAVVILLAWQGWGAWAMAVGFVLRNGLAALACWWVSKLHFSLNYLKISRLSEILPLLRFGLLDLGSRWADYLANSLDKLVVGKMLGAEALGYYNLAFTFLMLPTARLGYIITRTTFPIYAQVQHDPIRLQMFFGRAARQLVLVLFPVYTGMVLFSNEIVRIFFGEAWLPAAPLFIAFGVAGLVRTLAAPFPELVKGIGKPQWWLRTALLLMLAFNTALLLFLWANPTPVAAAWSRVAAKFLFEIALLYGLARRCGVVVAPTLRFAGRVVLWLVLVVVAVGVVEEIDVIKVIGWRGVLGLKILVFVGGVGWGAARSGLIARG